MAKGTCELRLVFEKLIYSGRFTWIRTGASAILRKPESPLAPVGARSSSALTCKENLHVLQPRRTHLLAKTTLPVRIGNATADSLRTSRRH